MTGDKKSGLNWRTLAGFLWAGMSPICLGLGLFFVAFYDSPIDRQAGMGFLDQLLIWSVLSFPIFCVIASVGILILNKRSKVAATFAALLPILPLIPIFAIFSWANSGQTDDHRDAIPVTECPSARVDGGDGLDTTGCGSLEAGLLGSGSLSTTAEAHNWQITAGSGQVRITVKNDGNSCPHVRVLDSRGAVAEGFEERNGLRLCPGGMITTGFFEFNPSGAGTYFIRVFSPETSGAYWISID